MTQLPKAPSGIPGETAPPVRERTPGRPARRDRVADPAIRRRPRGMTLVEMIITVVALSIALFLLTGWLGSLRESAKEALAMRMLADLDDALSRYRRATGEYPVSRGPGSDIPAVLDLVAHEKTRPILERFPGHVWQGPGGSKRRLIDPWGTVLRYLPPDSEDEKVRANGGRPLFVSAGPDRDFGDGNPSAVADNIRSDDPGPDGFRIHNVVREAFVEGEYERGEEDR